MMIHFVTFFARSVWIELMYSAFGVSDAVLNYKHEDERRKQTSEERQGREGWNKTKDPAGSLERRGLYIIHAFNVKIGTIFKILIINDNLLELCLDSFTFLETTDYQKSCKYL